MSSALPQSRQVVFSLGSNVGDRLATLEQVCDLLCEHFGDLRLSQLYETEPVGCPPGSPAYLNACVAVQTDLPAREILSITQAIEQQLGRKRSGVYGEPRTCDIDIICCGEETSDTPELTLPHPRAHLRAFVLQPLSDIDPLLVLPGRQQTVADLLRNLPDAESVTPFDI